MHFCFGYFKISGSGILGRKIGIQQTVRRNIYESRGSWQNAWWLEEKLGQSRKEKPRCIGAEKKILSQTKDELVVRSPLIRGIRPVVVQPDPVLIAFDVEHIRIAVRVRIV